MSNSIPEPQGEIQAFYYDVFSQAVKECRQSKALIQVRDFAASACKAGANTSLAIVDLEEVYRLHLLWHYYLHRVKPYYAIKCNRDARICELLFSLGYGFNCESLEDVQLCLNMGCDPEKITYTKRYKTAAYLRFAEARMVPRLSVDTETELFEIHRLYPAAQILIRIATYTGLETGDTQDLLGLPMEMVEEFLQLAKDLALNVVGVSFHAEGIPGKPKVFVQSIRRAVRECSTVMEKARQLGYHLGLVDIGGGFNKDDFSSTATEIMSALNEYLPSDCIVIAEPGQFFSRSAMAIASMIVGERVQVRYPTRTKLHSLYLSESVFSELVMVVLNKEHISAPVLVKMRNDGLMPRMAEEQTVEYAVRGSTGYPLDMLGTWPIIGDPDVGDWLYFADMGAYSRSPVSKEVHQNSIFRATIYLL